MGVVSGAASEVEAVVSAVLAEDFPEAEGFPEDFKKNRRSVNSI